MLIDRGRQRRAPGTAFVLPLPQDPRLKRIAQALIEKPGSEGTIDWWCDFAGLSRRSMTRQFRAQTGLSFGDWRRRLRLISAVARTTDGEPLARVAASLGYRDLSAFRAMASRYDASETLKPRR
jgi:AraC-like DNA-binding protein